MSEAKYWYQSRAVWGAIAALAATLIRASGHDPGVEGEAALAEAALDIATGLGALAALYGRLAATHVIVR